MFEADHRLPFDDILLPWALENDPEVARIIESVLAKIENTPQGASQALETPSNYDRQPADEDLPHPARVTVRNPRKRHDSPAARQKAYRARVAARAVASADSTV
jgi:hypothetical protein